MKENEIQDELSSIRNLMERSSKFISLSGLSGILAGVFALIGAAAAYYFIYDSGARIFNPYNITDDDIPDKSNFYGSSFGGFNDLTIKLLFIALLVLIVSLGCGIFLTMRKAKRKSQPIWGNTSRLILFHLATPLVTGGILILIFIHRGYYGIVAPVSLIFYGISLVSASNFTLTLVKYLGLCEIILGLIAACLPGYGLLFWAIGFGLLHIIYGSLMYLKYDR
ncbi:MAG: hypothetical protein JWP44_843 [Mucilaginibacter sp.]|nr:hypothetical protein [Mucilaginibacter sp.]